MRNGEQLPDGQSAKAYKFIDDCIKSWCGLIFNQFSPLEWFEGAATPQSAAKIAAVIDSAALKYIIESDQLVHTREILDECLRINPNLKIPNYSVLQSLHDKQNFRSALGIIVNEIPGYFTQKELEKIGNPESFPIDIPVNTISASAEESLKWREKNPQKCQARIDGFNEALLEDIAGKDEYFKDKNGYRLRWLKGYLKIDRILGVNSGIDIDDILKKINYDNCPAVTLSWTVREDRMKSGRHPEDNDVDDYIYLPAIPYADIALIEKKMCNHIIQADKRLKNRVFYKADDVVKVLEAK
jgi:hypothetical protein